MATLQQIKNKADAVLVQFWQALQQKQDAYFAKHGKYFQLLVTNDVVDGVDTTFEVRKPNDELHPIDVDFEFNLPIPFQIAVNEWVGETRGYDAVVTVKLLDGRIFRRSRNSEQVDSGWYEVIEQI